jgi:hypothetical protein
MRRGRSTAMRCFNSPSRAECPAAVIGSFVIDYCCQLGSGDLGLACRPFNPVLYNIDNALPLYVVTPAIDSDLWDAEPAETCHEANCFCGATGKNFDNLFF